MFFPVDGKLTAISNPKFCIYYPLIPTTKTNPGQGIYKQRKAIHGADWYWPWENGPTDLFFVVYLIKLDPVEGLQWMRRLGNTLLPEWDITAGAGVRRERQAHAEARWGTRGSGRPTRWKRWWWRWGAAGER